MDIAITLHRNEIIYDVEVASWRIAKTHFVDAGDKAVSEAKLSDELSDWVDRQIEGAKSEIARNIAFAITNKNVGDGDNTISECSCEGERCVSLALRFDEGWRGNADVLTSDMHDYIVSRILFEWLVMVAPSFASVYESKADRHLDRIVSEARSEVIKTPRFVL